jgi:hypothetical protein
LGWVGRSGSRGCGVVEAGEEVEECGVDLGGTLLLLACWAWLKTVWKLRWQAIEDGVGDEKSAEVVGRVVEWPAIERVGQAGVGLLR